MLSRQEEEQERREVLENDRLLREQQKASTFHQHAQAQALDTAGGRFAATGAPRVVGSTPNPSLQYPAASAAHQTELPREPSLGYSVDQLDPLESPSFAQGQLPDSAPAAAASTNAPLLPSDVVQRDAGSGPCSDGERDA
jgi:hypothetical protein